MNSSSSKAAAGLRGLHRPHVLAPNSLFRATHLRALACSAPPMSCASMLSTLCFVAWSSSHGMRLLWCEMPAAGSSRGAREEAERSLSAGGLFSVSRHQHAEHHQGEAAGEQHCTIAVREVLHRSRLAARPEAPIPLVLLHAGVEKDGHRAKAHHEAGDGDRRATAGGQEHRGGQREDRGQLRPVDEGALGGEPHLLKPLLMPIEPVSHLFLKENT